MGKAVQGQRAKMVNQSCIAGELNCLHDGLVLAEKSGLDIPTLVDCLENIAAGSRPMEKRVTIMTQDKFDCGFDFDFARDWILKGLGFYLDEAERQGI
ncbi:hypothetical protein BH581_08195 [Vibrio splendidus]|nr:hypothetical protein BH581_08195 [Vibrio splendidus]